jgi:hypothetical protein
MLTLFSCPKSFRGHVAIIQRNAIHSWTKLSPKPQIILLGNEEGTTKMAGEFGIRQIDKVARNEFGTPLVNSLFEEAERVATYERLCYVNADIILMSDFMKAIKRVVEEIPHSLTVGRRWDLDVKESLDFGVDWEQQLITRVEREGKISHHYTIDYFVFPKGVWGEIPPFAIGRPAWDNWVLYRARSQGMPIIDLSEAVMVVHQRHDYAHHPQGWKGAMKGDESKQNIKLAGETAHAHSLLDAQYYLTRKGVKRRITPYYRPYYLYQLLVKYSESRQYVRPVVHFIKKIGDRFLSHPR